MERIEHGIERAHGWYAKVLDLALRWRKVTLGTALALFIGSLALMPLIGGEMMPQTDDGFIHLRFKTAVGSSLEYTDGKVRQVEAALKEFKEIDSVSSVVGTNDGRNVAEVNVKLTDVKKTHRQRSHQIGRAHV